MKIYSENFDDVVGLSRNTVDAFVESAKDTRNFDEEEIEELIFFANEMYSEKKSPFKKEYSKKVYLSKFAELLNYLPSSAIMELKAYEVKRFFDGRLDLFFNNI